MKFCATNQSGHLQYTDFVKWAQDNPAIMQTLENLFVESFWKYPASSEVEEDTKRMKVRSSSSAFDINAPSVISCTVCNWKAHFCFACGGSLERSADLELACVNCGKVIK